MAECMYGNGDECGAEALPASIYCEQHVVIDGDQRGGSCLYTGQTEAEKLRLRVAVLERAVEQLARTVAALGGDHG